MQLAARYSLIRFSRSLLSFGFFSRRLSRAAAANFQVCLPLLEPGVVCESGCIEALSRSFLSLILSFVFFLVEPIFLPPAMASSRIFRHATRAPQQHLCRTELLPTCARCCVSFRVAPRCTTSSVVTASARRSFSGARDAGRFTGRLLSRDCGNRSGLGQFAWTSFRCSVRPASTPQAMERSNAREQPLDHSDDGGDALLHFASSVDTATQAASCTVGAACPATSHSPLRHC